MTAWLWFGRNRSCLNAWLGSKPEKVGKQLRFFFFFISPSALLRSSDRLAISVHPLTGRPNCSIWRLDRLLHPHSSVANFNPLLEVSESIMRGFRHLWWLDSSNLNCRRRFIFLKVKLWVLIAVVANSSSFLLLIWSLSFAYNVVRPFPGPRTGGSFVHRVGVALFYCLDKLMYLWWFGGEARREQGRYWYFRVSCPVGEGMAQSNWEADKMWVFSPQLFFLLCLQFGLLISGIFFIVALFP